MPRPSICILWHFHQPCYKDTLANKILLPWVRLHVVKDYFAMQKILEEFPEIKCNVNFTPSLLAQILDYLNGVSDIQLDLLKKPVETLTDDEAEFIIKNSFYANLERMIKPLPAYYELYEKDRQNKYFSRQDLLDLEVLSELAWINPCLLDSELLQIKSRLRNYSEQDKLTLLEREFTIIKDLIPAWARLLAKGQVEISTSPFYHPIVPLLCSQDNEDAQLQMKLAIELFQKLFEQRSFGMWLPECAVSDDALKLLIDHNISWVVLDEDNLAKLKNLELSRDHGPLSKDYKNLYRPYEFRSNGKTIKILFRDKFLSNLIGFTYKDYEPEKAADELVGYINEIAKQLDDDSVICIALDGENPWESYADKGVNFLRSFYSRLAQCDHVRSGRISDVLNECSGLEVLSHIESGSWIKCDFSVWSGHEEDKKAWQLLRDAHDKIDLVKDKLNTEAYQKAKECILVAEGSDWFWWFGPEFETKQDIEFDMLFRRQLVNAYKIAGLLIPYELYKSIKKINTERLFKSPWGRLSIRLDGDVSDYFEWLAAGKYDLMREHNPEVPFSKIYFGSDHENFYIRLDPQHKLTELSITIILLGQTNQEIVVEEYVINNIVEARIPFSRLNLREGDSVEFLLKMKVCDRIIVIPQFTTLSFRLLSKEAELITW